MAKITFDSEGEKAKKRYDYLGGILVTGMRIKHVSPEDVSRKTGIPKRTVYKRLECPEEIRVKDLYKLADIAGIKISFEIKNAPE